MAVITQGTQQRRFAFELRDAGDDGRTVYGRVVPYGETIEFVDGLENGQPIIKRERFIRGSLARQSKAWHLVMLSFEHLPGFANTVGYGRKLEEADDGAYATFRLYERDAAKAREMLVESHKGLSLEFRALQDRLAADGVIERLRVHVEAVSMVADPAYIGAQVLAIRSNQLATAGDVPGETSIVDSGLATPNLDSVLADLARLKGQQ